MDIIRLDIERTEPRPSENDFRLQAALLAAVAASAVSLIGRFSIDLPLIPELAAQYIFSIAPIWVVEFAVGMLGPFAKHLAFLACVVAYGLALTAAALVFLKFVPLRGSALRRGAVVSAFSFAVWALTVLIVLPVLDAGLLGRYLNQGLLFSSLSLLAVHAVYGTVLGLAATLYANNQVASGARPWLGRRRVIRGIGFAVLAAGVYDIGGSLLGDWFKKGSGRVKGGDGVFPNIDGLALEITPVADFYQVSKNPFDPAVDAHRWRVEIGGLVKDPVTLSYDDVKSLPAVEQYATLECIDNKVGGDLIGNALWRGVLLRDLLNRAGLQPGVVDIVLRASDGYRDSIPLSRAMSDSTMLAYKMNGAPLTREHGFPLRLIVPGVFGMKNVKWITRLEAVDYDFKGYWQARGWDDRAEYKTMSRIDLPAGAANGPATIAGIAFAGDRGISKVEISTDGGKNWQPAELKPPLSPYSWVLWHKEWNPEAPVHLLVVRATDGTGVTQTSRRAPAAPDGTSGHHAVTIDVEGESGK
jgi:hypothetical protein